MSPSPRLPIVLRQAGAAMAAALLLSLAPPAALAQTPAEARAQGELVRVEHANWELADRFRASELRPYIHSTGVNPQFINETDEFWYSWQDADGRRWMRVDPSAPSQAPLFDHALMAELLTMELGTPFDRTNLSLQSLEFSEDGESIHFRTEDTDLTFHLGREELSLREEEEEEEEDEDEGRPWRAFSPDSTAYVFAEGHDLYFVEMEDEDTIVRLTDDGEEYFSFGFREVEEDDDDEENGNREETRNDDEDNDDPHPGRVRPNVNWAEDSNRFYVVRSDSREVAELYLVDSLSEPRPTLRSYRYAMPGEENVTQFQLFAFDRPSQDFRELPVEKWPDQRLFNIHWTGETSDVLRMVRRDRPQRTLELIEVDLDNGDEIRVLLEESTENAHLRRQNVRYVEEDNQGDFLWYSRRTGWAHWYRYSHDGELRNAVTSGEWNAEAVQELDEDEGRVFIRGVGREEFENPYYNHLYRVNLDGSGLTLLDPGDANNTSRLSPSNEYVVTTRSRVDMAPQTVLHGSRGQVLLELEEMDLTPLESMGWQMPRTFSVKAADGITDIYGNMYLPFDFDPERQYPIIAHVYPGPQTESVRAGFSAVNQQQELAQLGFVVIQIGNRGGTPQRSAAYHSYGYFNLRDYGLADKKVGIEQLAARHDWIDLDRVGIYGHSGGGFMTAAALMLEPYNEFFTVGVSSAGNHDNNVYNQNWSEQHHGLEVKVEENEDGEEEVTFEIDVPTNHDIAEGLVNRLLLVHGDMDNNVHHAGTMRLAKALIDADKRFDFMMFPGMAHGFGGYSSYWRNMMFEYFAEHLLGDYYRDRADMGR
ncbi:MAG: S9 family peptidase [Gemmatimonadales bacterium]|nr:MAG: S9 family peptidase [Gemmatimonadales bacterium]